MSFSLHVSFDRVYVAGIFVTIAKEGSFAAAARKLNLAPSQVTKEIKKLEEHLQVKLLNRTTRSVSLTREGENYLIHANEILSRFAEAEESVRQLNTTPKGHLRITAPAVLGQVILSKLVSHYQIKHPEVEVELVLTDRVIDIVSDGFDMAIRTSFDLKDSSLFIKEMDEVPRLLCASRSFLKKNGTPKRLADLPSYNQLIFIRGQANKYWTFTKGKEQLDVPISGNFKTNNLLGLVEAAKAGLGIANIPAYLVEDELKKGKMVELFPTHKLPCPKTYLLYQQKRARNLKLDSFISFMEENYYIP
ncbi:MAG: LysR family transcriptional regulator [Halobacteriovoraceae bacterium]|jgi:DNA-binding transcriptional LysR family regulator|nr:LysR family transcriptional regulator [Halobacteriovoraceae bacterium]MBT5094263.1 LysR family transcriptional regulator [Halobacteriovoraceae bacterium]